MRIALLLPVLFSLAAPAYAEGARESRYGPTTARQTAVTAIAGPGVGPVAVAAPYTGPMLSWANKQQPSNAASIPASTAPARPAPVASWAGYGQPRPAAPAPTPPNGLYAPPRPSPAATAPPPAQVQPRDWSNYRSPRAPTAAPPQPAVTAPALPTSLYAAPRPTPVPVAAPAQVQAPAKDWSNYRSTRMATAAPTPTTTPAPPPPVPVPPAPQPRQVAAASPETPSVTGARFYSVTRDAGLTPDPIPPAGPDHQVLITGDAPTPPPSDAAPMHGSADWLAAGVAGDDNDQDDSSARRRAQTRNEAL